jgi:paraquat-inducible protein A
VEDARHATQVLTAHAAGLIGCTSCGKVHGQGAARCARCGMPLSPPDGRSLQKVWAWLIAGLIVYIPANVFPMLRTTNLGRTTDNTIIGGVVDLAEHGDYGVAAIVFIASVVIPLGKFAAIAYLALSISRTVRLNADRRHVLFVIVEFIGRWSMIDVFVVAILSSLVTLDFTATVRPGIAAVSFALSVAFTMVSALSFDPRLIWDNEYPPRAKGTEA